MLSQTLHNLNKSEIIDKYNKILDMITTSDIVQLVSKFGIPETSIRYYNNQLIIMTNDNNEEDVLKAYITSKGNHARGHYNQRQIDVIRLNIIPELNSNDLGIITPFEQNPWLYLVLIISPGEPGLLQSLVKLYPLLLNQCEQFLSSLQRLGTTGSKHFSQFF